VRRNLESIKLKTGWDSWYYLIKDGIKSKMMLKTENGAYELGEDGLIDEGVILNYKSARVTDVMLNIGPGARVRSGTIIYSGSRIGRDLETGHNVVIREANIIGDGLRIWNNSVIDYGCRIGNNVKIHTKVYIAQFTTIEDDVFMAPGVTLANDIHPGCPDAGRCMQGPHIKKGAQIGINCTILPRVVIGEYSVIGAGSVVTKNIPPRMVAYGNPARVVSEIGEMKCSSGLRDKPYSHITWRI
jgi:acetyltransferase-like isoleucine patch superfamily enzyme